MKKNKKVSREEVTFNLRFEKLKMSAVIKSGKW